MVRIILPETSLCAIVRDEMMNPAGGIVDFVESTMPYVEAGVIVDTGSLDGTREKLEELAVIYPNLRIYDHKFIGFAQARNYSLKQVQTKRALVLDADERLTDEDFQRLKNLVGFWGDLFKGYNFEFLDVYTDEPERRGSGHNPRLFRVEGANYLGRWEFLESFSLYGCYDTQIVIKHFHVSRWADERKIKEWYEEVMNGCFKHAPSEIASFREWKAYNPLREKYR